MFTGIVRGLGEVLEVGPGRLVVSCPFQVEVGGSLAVNGVCLTVKGRSGGAVEMDVSAETLSRTTLGRLRPGERVNLEPALRAGDELGGHLVMGHVDTVGKITLLSPRGEEVLLEVAYDPRYGVLLADKASVAVDGISLTPFSVREGTFRCALIPYTWENTALRYRRVGDPVNLEFDILAKYVRGWRERI
jgi:riboflavin synthase